MAGIGNVFSESAVGVPELGEEVGCQREQKSPFPQWKVNELCLKLKKKSNRIMSSLQLWTLLSFFATMEKPLLISTSIEDIH